MQNYKGTRLSCYTGYVSQAITVNLAPLLFVIFQEKFHLSLAFIAIIPLITFLIQILIDSVSILFVEKASYRFLALSSQLTSFAGLIMLSFLPDIIDPRLGIIISILVYSSGSALAELVLSPLVDSLPAEEGSGSSMTFLHSFYSWGQAAVILLTTLILKIVGADLWELLPLMWAAIPFINTVAFMKVPMPEMSVRDPDSLPGKSLVNPAFFLAFLIMICAGATEQVMAQWASLFAESGLGVSKVVGDIVGPCSFAVLMALGRMLHGLYGGKLDMKKLLMFLSGFTIICYLITVFSSAPIVSLIGCGLSGIGVSIMWPGMLALCSGKYPGAGASMFAVLALGGDIGCSVGPYLSGSVSDMVSANSFFSDMARTLGLLPEQLGLRAGFLVSVIFPLVMLLGISLIRNEDIHSK